MLIELLVLTNVCLFTLLALRLVHEAKLFLSSRVLLVLELSDAVVGQLSLNVAALTLHLQTMLIQCLDEVGYIFLVDLAKLGLVRVELSLALLLVVSCCFVVHL